MSGKLIMKRKRADQQRTLPVDEHHEHHESGGGGDATAEKRQCLDVNLDSVQPNDSVRLGDVQPNGILFEALQKIMELQAELDAFEQDLDERESDEEQDCEEEARLDAEVAANFATPERRSEAEALGFAMCARETLLFLQSEGISPESDLYKALLSKLVGQSDGLLQV